jgi:hypothetical protein
VKCSLELSEPALILAISLPHQQNTQSLEEKQTVDSHCSSDVASNFPVEVRTTGPLEPAYCMISK